MPVISEIKPQKNKKRVNVYLDGKFAFGIDLDNLVKLNLKVEQELSDKEVEDMVRKAEFQKTLDKLLRFVTLRPRSEKEIKDWLKKKKVHDSLYKKLFDRLNRLDLVDDANFAKWWVEQRNVFKPRGKRALEAELRIKGIKREVISKILDAIEIDEEKVAMGLLKKKEYKWRNLPKRDAKQKKGQYLLRKGFGWEVISKVLGGRLE